VSPIKKLDKARVVDAFLASLEATLYGAEQNARKTAEAATHEEARPENDKDTRAVEESYLARDLKLELALLRALEVRDFGEGAEVASGALVTLENEEGEVRTVLIGPAGGGLRLVIDGVRVDLVTPASPLGTALLGREEGDEIDVKNAGKPRSWELVEVR
jgi:transcription elongation GreA/GreB family factor